MRGHIKEIGYGALLTAGCWICLFFWCSVISVYNDHQGLVKRNGELLADNKVLAGERDKFKEEANEKKQGESPEALLLREQLQTAKEQLELEYMVSVDLVYQDKQLKIFNRGKTNLFLWGTRFNDFPRDIEKEPRLISPSPQGPFGIGESYYFLSGDSLERTLLGKFGDNGGGFVPMELFITDQRKKKHIIRFTLLVRVVNRTIQISPQNIGVVDSDW